ncbi:MAG: hypothetical protein K0S78_89 [Thermomicrobiales bacterium]|jgi:hypothetical protein|nr:hypothetical protein [Thermomicrobiales bacterium]MDF3037301.1 hypothetical protein [Thermomicrobiales bacterium]
MASETPFDPTRHLTRVSGSDYLEVKWRLVWLRDRHPDATLETELVSHHDNTAIFRAQVQIPGGGAATGWGSEAAGDFRDYLEKAETKAIGRALAALGFGTQFCPDHEFGAANGRVVDSPVKPARASRASASSERQESATVAAIGPDQGATQRQLRYLQAVAREAGLDGAALDERAMQEFGVQAVALSRRDASTLIDLIQSQSSGAKLAS